MALAWGLVAFFSRAVDGFHRFEFGDESEKLVTAQLIEAGGRYYLDYVNHHGPFPYVLTHAYALLAPEWNFSGVRLIPVLLALLACWAIVTSPVLKGRVAQIWAAAMFLGPIASFWVVQSLHMVNYHGIVGLLIAVVLAQFVVPAMVGERVTQGGAFAAGVATTLVCFSSISAGPTMFLLPLAATAGALAWRRNLQQFAPVTKSHVLGILLGLTVMVLWLLAFADLKAFLVYNFYFNLAIYARYLQHDVLDGLGLFRLDLRPGMLIASFAKASFWMALLLIGSEAVRERFQRQPDGVSPGPTGRRVWFLVAVLLFASAFVVLSTRLYGFVGGALYIAAPALLALLLARQFNHARCTPGRLIPNGCLGLALATLVLAELVGWLNPSSPHNLPHRQYYPADLQRQDSQETRLIDLMSEPGERIQSLVYAPALYIYAGRYPASAHMYYLPWMAEYVEAPVLGVNADICEDLRGVRPPVIRFDNWTVRSLHGSYPPRDFMPCVLEILEAEYTATKRFPHFYVRNDRLAARRERPEVCAFLEQDCRPKIVTFGHDPEKSN
jgi:hypothetical protein